jgi:tRNA pseudouridine55 synthase
VVNGIILLDKPLGISSNGALQRVKRLFDAAKAGHTGALDPLATGLLPLCFGESTKFSQFLLDADKRYQTTAKLGIKTASGDAEGEVLETRPVETVSSERVRALLAEHFSGEITQVPSMYSALKHEGQPLYKLARQGIEVKVKSRQVHIHRIELLAVREDELDLDIWCSKGTYVRSIVEDLGELLGCGAHVSCLRRLESGPYRANMMISLEQIEAIADALLQPEGKEGTQQALDALLLPVWSPLEYLPALCLEPSQADQIRQGKTIRQSSSESGLVRLFASSENGDELFLGLAELTEEGEIVPRRLMSTQ